MSARDHAAYQDEVGAYLLSALTDLEVQAFERHMAHCPNCRDEVERLRPAADSLPRAVVQLEPPPTLKTALMEVVEQEAEERAGESAPPPRRPRRRFMPLLRPVLVAGALLLGAAAGFGVARLSEEEPQESRTLAAKVDQSRIPDGSGRLVVQGEGDNGAILRVQGMPSLQPNEVYQAWVLREGTIVPQPTFEVGDTGGGAVAIPDNLSGAQEVLVTRERRGGARAPTEEPILAVRL
jgi:Anti-sigma-K factor rskA/Putative zinc-finger